MVKKRLIIFVVLATIFSLLAVRYTFFYIPKCETYGCFASYMKQCENVIFVNDDIEATWKYEILSNSDKRECEVEVTLIQPKTGDLALERLDGYKMTCLFQKGAVAYPERDLDKCHGILKEEMQGIVIKKLHTYIVENLDIIDDSLDSVS